MLDAIKRSHQASKPFDGFISVGVERATFSRGRLARKAQPRFVDCQCAIIVVSEPRLARADQDQGQCDREFHRRPSGLIFGKCLPPLSPALSAPHPLAGRLGDCDKFRRTKFVRLDLSDHESRLSDRKSTIAVGLRRNDLDRLTVDRSPNDLIDVRETPE
jgi:hypothetical protein